MAPNQTTTKVPPLPKVLIVEDDEDVRFLIQRSLQATCELCVAPDGVAALNLAKSWKPELILLDRRLPLLDGLVVLRELKDDANTAQIPVIILSGLRDLEDRVEGLRAGACDYVVKPFESLELVARVESVLRQSRLSRAAPSDLSGSESDTVMLGRTVVLASEHAASEAGGTISRFLDPQRLVLEDDSPSDAPTLGSRLEVKELLGEGGQALIYRVHHRLLRQDMALKLVRSDRLNSPNARSRFFSEARIVARLTSPNIVALREFGETARGDLYMLLDLVEGKTLHRLLQEQGRMAPRRAVDLVAQILDALAVAHAEGVIHRDIKPENVMVGEDDMVHVLDFGLAKLLQPDPDDPRLTRDGVVVGTPLYMSPEQVRGAACDERSDLYSTGLVLYELLTGAPPFGSDGGLEQTMHRQLHEIPLPPSLVSSACAPLDGAVLKALAKDPAQRFDSALAMSEALLATWSGDDAQQLLSAQELHHSPRQETKTNDGEA